MSTATTTPVTTDRPAPPPAPVVTTLVLAPPVTRGAGTLPVLSRPAATEVVRIEASFVVAAISARIDAVDGPAEILRAEVRAVVPAGAVLEGPATKLPAGDYTITFADARGRAVARAAFRIE